MSSTRINNLLDFTHKLPPTDFDDVFISSSVTPVTIRAWSYQAPKKPEVINYRTYKPEHGTLGGNAFHANLLRDADHKKLMIITKDFEVPTVTKDGVTVAKGYALASLISERYLIPEKLFRFSYAEDSETLFSKSTPAEVETGLDEDYVLVDAGLSKRSK